MFPRTPPRMEKPWYLLSSRRRANGVASENPATTPSESFQGVRDKTMQPPFSSEARRSVPAATSVLIFALVLALLAFAFST